MFLTKHPNQIWYLYFLDENGKRKRISTRCRLKSDALRFLQSFKEEEHARQVKRNRTTLSLFSKDYLNYSASIHTAKTLRSNKTALAEFLRIIGDIGLQRVTPREIETFLAQKTQEASVWTARKYFLALSSVFETAKRWSLISANPFRNVQSPKVPEVWPSYLTQAECVKLFSVIDDRDFRELVECALLTGMRQGEILALRWDAVDFARQLIAVRNTETFLTKNKRERIIPMNQSLWGMLLQRKERTGGGVLVFHRNGQSLKADNVTKRFKKYIRKADLNEALHWHSLRHTFASLLVQQGVSLYEIQILLGHSSLGMTQKYAHLATSELHSAVNRILFTLN